MDFQKTTFDNGFRLITVPLPNVASVTLEILVGAGSRYEAAKISGISHFLEHMFFKGTKRWPTARALSTEVDSIGGEFNAFTGKESTAYYLKTLGNHLERAFSVLCDMVLASRLETREIEREKNVIAAEIALGEDTPARKVRDDFETLLYPNSALGWDILGTVESVRRVRRADFQNLMSQFYRPEDIVAVVAGGFEEERARTLAQKYLGEITTNNQQQRTAVKEKFVQAKPQVLLKTKKTEQAHFVLGVRGNARGHPQRWAEELLATILGGGMSSRLWIAVRERRGLAYYVNASVNHYADNGYLAAAAGVEPGKITEAIKIVMSEFDSLRSAKNLSEKELTKAKEFIKGHLALELEDTRAVADFYGTFELLEGKILTPKEIFSAIDKVNLADVSALAKKFCQNQHLNLAVIGPYNDTTKFQKLLKL